MTPPKNDYPWWARLLTESIKSFGVTTVIVLAAMYWLGTVFLPAVIDVSNRYCNAVELTQETLSETQKRMVVTQEKLIETQEQLVRVVDEVSVAAQEIVAVEKESQQFMQMVQDQHAQQLGKLSIIETAVTSETP